jgi:pyrroloquinoline quinone biosynthesis protein B
MKVVFSVLLALIAASELARAASPYVVVLGVGQDAGVPQMGCDTPFCRSAWKDPKLKRWVSSIALVDPDSKSRWIFDATPDLPEQFEFLKQITRDHSNTLSGILLTHAHIGHYTGLMYLGRESMSAKNIPIYAMPRMREMLQANAPWSQLVSLKNIDLRELADKRSVTLTDDLSVVPFLVPHRDEFSETVGFKISSSTKSLVFIPDIDKWQRWQTSLADLVKVVDFLLLDGTFYADGEIGRPMSEVPHPFVSETMALLRDLSAKDRAKVFFIHFNHSNPLVQADQKKLREVKSAGFGVATVGQKINL